MKKGFSKVIACFLAVLMIVTSLPLAALANIEDDFYALQTAIGNYEAKMNGTKVYSNMTGAYNAYVKAKEYEYAYSNGNRTDLDLADAANQLTTATNNMTEWTQPDVESPVFNYGGTELGDFTKNIVYSSTPGIAGGVTKEDSMFKFISPQNLVVIYGLGDIKFPVMCAYHNNSGLFATRNKGAFSFYLNKDDANLTDNAHFQLQQQWNGHYILTKSGGPASASDFIWGESWTNPTEEDKIPGYNYNTDAATGWESRGQYMVNNNGDKWWEYANVVYYVGSEQSFTNGLQTVPFGWVGHTYRKNATSDGIYDDQYHYYYTSSEDASGKWGGTIYVIDYSGVKSAINSAKGKYFDLASKTYLKHELDDVFDAVKYLQTEPVSSFSDSNYASRAKTVASDIQTKNTYLTNSNIAQSDLTDYDNLATYLTNYKAIRTGGNNGVYTEDSYADFVTAYDAAVTEAGKVAEDGFTSTTAGAALRNAYLELDKITQPSGNAGDTSYTFDNTTGTVEITGPGSTGNYENGNESPLGGNPDIKEVVVGEDVTVIGANTFAGDNNLETIYVPASATYGEGAFDGCTKLRNVIIYGGEVKDVSAANAPWTLPSVKVVKLGKDKYDYSVTSIGENVFTGCDNTAFYFYYSQCDIPDETASTLGTKPTIYGYEPSTAKAYYDKFVNATNNMTFVSLGHDHVWVPTVHDPTCVAKGYTSYKCQYCDETKPDDTFVNALGHDIQETVVPPSCTERGYTIQKCSRCEYENKVKYTSKTPHTFSHTNYEQTYSSGQPYKETEKYKHSEVCDTCGIAKQENYCKFKPSGTTTVAGVEYAVFTCETCGGTYLLQSSVPAGKHLVIYQGLSNEIIKTDNVDNGTVPTDIPALPAAVEGHTYVWQKNGVDIDPSVTPITEDTVYNIVDITTKYIVTYLDKNGGYLDEEEVAYNASPASVPVLPADVQNRDDLGHEVYAWKLGETVVTPDELNVKNNITLKQVIVLTQHTFTETVISPASCSREGLKTLYCDLCGFSQEAEVAKLDHTIVNTPAVAATCTKPGKTEGSYCSVCEEVFKVSTTIPAKGHKWNGGVVTKEPTPYETGIRTYTCSVCKATRNEVIPKVSIADITPSDDVANKAKVNKAIKKPAGITTISNAKKKQMTVYFNKVPGAQNYRVMYRKAGAKKWTYSWTKGKTEFTFKNLKNGGLYEFCFSGYKKNAKGVWERGDYSKISYRYYYKAKVKKVTAGKKQFKVAWKADKKATGYEIVYGTSKKYSKGKRVKVGKKTTSKTIKGLKKGKKYYIWVRSLKKKGGKTYTGEYSTKKKIKVK